MEKIGPKVENVPQMRFRSNIHSQALITHLIMTFALSLADRSKSITS